MGGTFCTLTIDNQSRHSCSIAKGVIVWFDFKDVEGVCPVEIFFFGWLAFIVEEDKVRREVKFVEHPASELLRVIDMIVLRDFWRDTIECGPRQNIKNSICGVHQWRVE